MVVEGQDATLISEGVTDFAFWPIGVQPKKRWVNRCVEAHGKLTRKLHLRRLVVGDAVNVGRVEISADLEAIPKGVDGQSAIEFYPGEPFFGYGGHELTVLEQTAH